MMRKILALSFLLSLSAVAQDNLEEAIILNQELEFLQEAAQNVTVNTKSQNKAAKTGELKEEEENLESLYFGESRDVIQTKEAAPQRKVRTRGQ